jgi:putative ABC transport system permease protein
MSAGARFVLAMAWRESRASLGRLWLLTASVSLGVAALVAINSFTDDLRVTVRDQARSLLGADVGLGSSAPFSAKAEAELGRLAKGAELARAVRFAGMAYAPGGTGARLVQVTAVEGGYPFYGPMVTDPPDAWSRLASGGAVLVDPSLPLALSARVGEELKLGDARFRIAGVVTGAPGDVAVRSAFGPRVFMASRDLVGTHLLGPGARARYEAYVKLPAGADAQRLADRHRAPLAAERVTLRTVSDQGRDLDRTLGRLGRHLEWSR